MTLKKEPEVNDTIETEEIQEELREEKPPRPHKYASLRHAVRYFYDLQKIRIQTGNRNSKHTDGSGAELTEEDKAFLVQTSEGLAKLEKDALKEVSRLLKPIPIYVWLKAQKGCGPTLSGVIVAELETAARYETASKMWAYAGLHVDTRTNTAARRRRGEKANWNNFLKTKLLGVLAPCLIKANSPWRKFYDDYKHRKASAGWGKSDGHRHAAAMRYMVKMFLLELWKEWRTLEGLPVTPTYAEAKLGIRHGDHAAISA